MADELILFRVALGSTPTREEVDSHLETLSNRDLVTTQLLIERDGARIAGLDRSTSHECVTATVNGRAATEKRKDDKARQVSRVILLAVIGVMITMVLVLPALVHGVENFLTSHTH
ncbi:hypothetical protein [Leucobacter sp. cx-169]|uniref:hypothetical protein n=1 Tax=Leucobacter sp. cx-169 TaxID=2770549 RepID=UPI00165DD7CC|nr:hypothetical protein [Leucobacter sp. cx-169]MBC9927225.1 hypothetical protein [Leucobacter sp. cx-169]